MNTANDRALRMTSEREITTRSGYGMLAVALVLSVASVGATTMVRAAPAPAVTVMVIAGLLTIFVLAGFYLLQPNQAAAILLFGDYQGTDRTTGLRWTWPWLSKKKVRCASKTSRRKS